MTPRQSGVWQGSSFAPVDTETVLEIAQIAIGLPVVAEGGAAGLDRLGQNGADVAHEPRDPGGREIRPACRRGEIPDR